MSNVAQFWAEQFVDDSNNPFAGCKVYHYEAGTTSTKAVYRDRAKTTEAEQPVLGDSLGVVWFYGDGLYRLRVTTSDDVLLYDWDNVEISANTLSLEVTDCEEGMVPVYVGPDNLFECQFLDLAFVNGCLPIANCGTGTDDVPAAGKLLIGNSSGGYTVANMTSIDGSIEITNGNGSIDLSVSSDVAQTFGSIGQRTTATGTTVTLTADMVVVRSVTEGSSYVINEPASVSASATTTGTGGRDQTAAFTAGSWVHAYWLYRPADETADPEVAADLKAVLSVNPPPDGPTLTSGAFAADNAYTHWCYAGAFRFDSSSAFVDMRVSGNMQSYNQRQEALEEGTASSESSVDLAALVPPNALTVQVLAIFAKNNVFSKPHAMISPYTGMAKETSFAFLTSGEDPEGDSQSFLVPNVSQKVYYINDSSGGGQKYLYMYVQGYTVPNNGA